MDRLFRLGLLLLLTCLLMAGCSDDTGGSSGDAGDSGGGDASDVGSDVPVSNPCLDEVLLDFVLDLDPSGGEAQIHAAAAWDGDDGMWITYTRDAVGGSQWEIWAQRIGCNGATRVAPRRMHETGAASRIDSVVAVSGGAVLIAWQSDDAELENNLDIQMRVLSLDGTFRTDVRTFEGRRDDTANASNAWMPSVTALPGGQFGLSGAWGVDEVNGFQVFLQRLTVDANRVGDAIDASIEAEVGQLVPSLAATAGGDLRVAYTRSPIEGNDSVLHTAVAAGANVASPAPPPALVTGQAGAGASLAVSATGQVFAAYSASDGSVTLVDATGFDPDPARVALGASGRTDQGPAVTAQGRGGAVAWTRVVQGTRSELLVQSFSFTDGGFVLGTEVDLTGEDPVGAYVPALVPVGGDTYFVSWSEGTNPEFRVKGQFIELPSP